MKKFKVASITLISLVLISLTIKYLAYFYFYNNYKKYGEYHNALETCRNVIKSSNTKETIKYKTNSYIQSASFSISEYTLGKKSALKRYIKFLASCDYLTTRSEKTSEALDSLALDYLDELNDNKTDQEKIIQRKVEVINFLLTENSIAGNKNSLHTLANLYNLPSDSRLNNHKAFKLKFYKDEAQFSYWSHIASYREHPWSMINVASRVSNRRPSKYFKSDVIKGYYLYKGALKILSTKSIYSSKIAKKIRELEESNPTINKDLKVMIKKNHSFIKEEKELYKDIIKNRILKPTFLYVLAKLIK